MINAPETLNVAAAMIGNTGKTHYADYKRTY